MKGIKARAKFVWEYLVNLPLLQAALGISSGVIIGMELVKGVEVLKIFSGCCLFIFLLSAIFFKNKASLAIVVFILFSLIGLFRLQKVYGPEFLEQVKNNYGIEVENLELISDGQKDGQNKVFTAKALNGAAGKESHGNVKGNILIKLPRDSEARFGDVIEGRFELEEPKNPDGFDYKFYLATQGVFYTAKSSSFKVVEHKIGLLSWFSEVRVAASSRIRKVLPEPHASLVAGLLWGERANMPEKFKNNLARTGTTHIIAVSGFNVSMLVLIMLKLAGFVPRRVAVWFTVLILACFLILVGLSNTPAMRAGIMGFSVLLAKIYGRKVSFLSLISIPVILLLIMNPLALYTVSFQLSFSAMIGIIVFAKPLMYHLYIIPVNIREEAATTIAAIIATSPVTIVNFQSFSLVALFVNLLVLPTVTMISLLGLINLIAAIISTAVGRLISFFVVPIMNYLIWVINFFGSLSFASITVPRLSQRFATFLYCLMLFIAIEIAFRKRVDFYKYQV